MHWERPVQRHISMTCHKRTDYAGVGYLRTIAKYASERDRAAARVFLDGSRETFSSLRQLFITNVVAGNLNRTARWKSGAGLEKPMPDPIGSAWQHSLRRQRFLLVRYQAFQTFDAPFGIVAMALRVSTIHCAHFPSCW